MLKRLTVSHTATRDHPTVLIQLESETTAHVLNKPTNSRDAHARVEQDLDSFATRADRYRESRRIDGVITSAQQLKTQMIPGKICLREGPGEKKKVRFDNEACASTSVSVDMQPAHWIDGFHEPEGTHPSLIVNGENEKHEDRVRRAIDEDNKSWSTAGTFGSIAPSSRAQANEFYFHTGENTGAELLVTHMSTHHLRWSNVMR